jgi:hypothetical protein
LFLNARKVLKDAVEVNAMHAPHHVVALLVTASAIHVPLSAVTLVPQPVGAVAAALDAVTRVTLVAVLRPQAVGAVAAALDVVTRVTLVAVLRVLLP